MSKKLGIIAIIISIIALGFSIFVFIPVSWSRGGISPVIICIQYGKMRVKIHIFFQLDTFLTYFYMIYV